MANTGTRRARRGKRGDMPATIAKSYKVARSVVRDIEKIAPEYGSLGRMLQVATELLIRIPKPLKVSVDETDKIINKTYKLTPRTIELIEQLNSAGYKKRGDVLAACVAILKND
jgi:hypothetical protein